MGKWLDRVKKSERPASPTLENPENQFPRFSSAPEAELQEFAGMVTSGSPGSLAPSDGLPRKISQPTSARFRDAVTGSPAQFQRQEISANDPWVGTEVDDLLDWRELDAAYQAHHWTCPRCIAAGQSRGQRCPMGLNLWRNYEAAAERPKSAQAVHEVSLVAPEAAVASLRSPDEPSMSDVEIERFQARVERLTSRALGLTQAEALADSLLIRDRQRDDRRMCVECIHCTSTRRCSRTQQAGIGLAPTEMLGDLAMRLQRCPAFKTYRPNPTEST